MKIKVAKLKGRPAKPGADLAQVEVIASLGLVDSEIAVILGISERTLNYWKKNPEFLQSLKRGKLKADFKVTQSLYQKAIGYKAVDKNKNVIDVPGDTTAMIFWLKNRQPDRWRDRHDIEMPGVENALYELSEKFLPAVSKAEKKPAGRGHEPK